MNSSTYYDDLALANAITNAVIRLNKRMAEATAAGLTVKVAVGAIGNDGGRARSGCEVRAVKVRREGEKK